MKGSPVIDHLQIVIPRGGRKPHCVAASEGATTLTGYFRLQLQTPSVCQSAVVGRGSEVLEERADARRPTITTRAGQDVVGYAAAVEEILPGFHVAACAAA